MFELKVRKIGNSLGTILPRELLEELHLKEGDSTLARQDMHGVTLMRKKVTRTLGKGERAKTFTYSGSVEDGVIIQFESGNVHVSASIFKAALSHFAGREVVGGFDKVNIQSGGFGEWLNIASAKKLNPKHGSFVAAILATEAGVRHRHDGNAVILQFP